MSRFIHIVDDDRDVRDSLRAVLTAREPVQIVPHVSGDRFLEAAPGYDAAVVILDMHMPGASGIEVLQQVKGWDQDWPVVVVTGQGNVAMAVDAMRLGAVDFLEKPYDHRRLFASVDLAFERLERSEQLAQRRRAAAALLQRLSPRERVVLDHVIEGSPNKVVAARLGLSVRTVELHRANMMAKLDVRSLPEAVRIVFAAA